MARRDQALNIKHADNPKIGDYWQEMLCGICVVMDVTEKEVVICKTKKELDNNYWTWNYSQTKIMTRKEFSKYVRYDTMQDKTWCDVHSQCLIDSVMSWQKDQWRLLRTAESKTGGVKMAEKKSLTKAQIVAEANAEIDKETAEKYKKQYKSKLRELTTAEVLVSNLKRELEDLELKMENELGG